MNHCVETLIFTLSLCELVLKLALNVNYEVIYVLFGFNRVGVIRILLFCFSVTKNKRASLTRNTAIRISENNVRGQRNSYMYDQLLYHIHVCNWIGNWYRDCHARYYTAGRFSAMHSPGVGETNNKISGNKMTWIICLRLIYVDLWWTHLLSHELVASAQSSKNLVVDLDLCALPHYT